MYNNTNTQKDKDGEHNAEEEKSKRKTVVKKKNLVMDVMLFTLKPFKPRVIRTPSDTRSGEFDVSAPKTVAVLSRDKYQKHCDWMPTNKQFLLLIFLTFYSRRKYRQRCLEMPKTNC